MDAAFEDKADERSTKTRSGDMSDDSSDGDNYSMLDSDVDSDDDYFDNSNAQTREEVEQSRAKFIEKYSKSCMQAKVFEGWRDFDKDQGRRWAKGALKEIKSGSTFGQVEWRRSQKRKGRYIGFRNNTYGNSVGKRPYWPGDLPEFRFSNIKQEFVSWMKIFGWEVDTVTLTMEEATEAADDKLCWEWSIKIPLAKWELDY